MLSPDHHLVLADGTYLWTPERVKQAWATVTEEARKQVPLHEEVVLLVGAPGSGKTTWLSVHEDPKVLYVDAVFPSARIRQKFLDEIGGHRRPTRAVCLLTSVEECLCRNARRTPDRKIPEAILRSYHETLTTSLPTLDEGFTQVLFVEEG